MAALPISAVIIARDEAGQIEACLRPLLRVADEVLVVDSGSRDDTVERCRQLGARVLESKWQGYAQTKNFGNHQARHDWILSVDADEVLSEELEENLRKLQLQPGHAYSLDRLTNYCGRWIRHSGWYPDWKVRLFDRRTTEWTGDYVHETLRFDRPPVIERLAGRLYHYSYRTSGEHWARIERYAQLAAEELLASGKKVPFWKPWLSPPARFLRTLLLKRAFLDGRAGWTIAWRNGYLVWRRYRLISKKMKVER